ncbi:MAG: hypothetical protein JWM93_2259 [Frankiales bacterium]|nr:hypothetical protein [Frankiales bacterium]
MIDRRLNEGTQLMTNAAAVSVCLILGALAVFQGALVLGAPLGRFAWGGQHRVLPTKLRAGSVAAVLIYGVIAAVVLARADLWRQELSETMLSTATWVVVAYLLLGVAGNLASRSKPERMVMAPVSAVLGLLTAVVALN